MLEHSDKIKIFSPVLVEIFEEKHYFVSIEDPLKYYTIMDALLVVLVLFLPFFIVFYAIWGTNKKKNLHVNRNNGKLCSKTR